MHTVVLVHVTPPRSALEKLGEVGVVMTVHPLPFQRAISAESVM